MRLKQGIGLLGVLIISAVFVISVLINGTEGLTISVPHPRPMSGHFMHRMGPPQSRSAEDESEEDENESQARVEPQITALNRDECLAKLLCGMSVPVTGGGAPKNGYYSQYANIVGKFFEAFPLEDDEANKSVESMEAYDDYSVEDDKPHRQNSKIRNVEKISTTGDKSASTTGGLQLIDLAVVKQGPNNASGHHDDERDGRSKLIDLRIARARKIVAKLGEKLQTVRQCQQISGCPFTFKQLRAKIKSTPSVSPPNNVPQKSNKPTQQHSEPESAPMIKYTYNTNSYKPINKFKPDTTSTSVTLGGEAPYKDTHKGDDELEEFFGPPPVFGANGRPISAFGHNRQKPSSGQQHQQTNNNNIQHNNVEYVPYEPPVKYGSKAQVQSGSPFPKKKIGYKGPHFANSRPTGHNDEWEDINQSTGPIAFVGSDDLQQQSAVTNAQAETGTEGGQADDGAQGDDDEDYDDDYEDEDAEEDEEDEVEADDEEDEEEEEEDEEKEVKKKTKKKKVSEKESIAEPTTKPKRIKNYKKPAKESVVVIEEDFPKKNPGDDDESEHPDNAWSKLAFATSGAVIKEPENKTLTKLQQHNDQKLGLSKESTSNEEVSKEEKSEEESKEEEEEDDQEQEIEEEKKAEKTEDEKTTTTTRKSPFGDSDDDEAEEEKSRRKKPKRSKNKNQAKLSLKLDDEEEFDKVTAALSTTKPKTKKKSNKNRSKNSNKTSKKETKKTQKKQVKKPVSIEDKSEEEEKPSKPKIQPLLEIGGRPMVPAPVENKQKKTGALSRFNFNLVRPFGIQTKEQVQAANYQQITMPKAPTLPNYSKPQSSSSSSSSNSYRGESLFGGSGATKNDASSSSYSKPQSYVPSLSPSFGSSHKPSSASQSGQSQSRPGFVTFPFAAPLSTLKNLFGRRPASSSNRQEPSTNGGGPPPISAFVHRPIGPESHQFKRDGPQQLPSRARSDKVKVDKKPKTNNNNKNKGNSNSKKSVVKKNSRWRPQPGKF